MLERLELTPETEAMWEQLSALALEREDILTAERCFGATGNVAKARYLHKVNKMARAVELESGMPGSGLAHHTVQSKLAVLAGNLPRAEQQLLQQGLIEETMEMYQARGRSARDGREMGARWARGTCRRRSCTSGRSRSRWPSSARTPRCRRSRRTTSSGSPRRARRRRCECDAITMQP